MNRKIWLLQVLAVIISEDPNIIFSVSLAELAAILLMHLNELESYIVLKSIIEDYKMKDLFIPGSPMLFQCFFIHDQLLELNFPRISVHFVSLILFFVFFY